MINRDDDSVVQELPLSSPLAVTSAHTTTSRATARLESREKILPLVIYYNWSRAHDLVPGYDFQVGDWVCIDRPSKGQPHEGEVIGVMHDRLLKIEGAITIGDQDTITMIKRSPKNITLEGR